MDASALLEAVQHLQAGDWQTAHEIVQRDEDAPLACWAHGIVHVMEGDTPNARYWFRKAGRPYSEDVAAEILALSTALRK